MAHFIQENGQIQGKDSADIFLRQWIPDKPVSILIIVHGIGEHSGRYTALAESLAAKRTAVYIPDLRGHGNSSGVRGHVQSFRDYIYDIKILCNKINDTYKGLPLFIMGHSMGGVIAARYALTYKNDCTGLLLSSPAFKPTAEVPSMKKFFSSVLSSIKPAALFSTNLDTAKLSHDDSEIKAYVSDPLVHDKITPRLYIGLNENTAFCLDHASEITIPLLVLHGTDDAICSIHGSELFVQRSTAADKSLTAYQGLFHELLHEIPKERKKACAAIISWISEHHITVQKEKFTSVKKSKAKTAPKLKKSTTAKKTKGKIKSGKKPKK
jgi:alpha-beta hydrolase superfamily lysophospholipase